MNFIVESPSSGMNAQFEGVVVSSNSFSAKDAQNKGFERQLAFLALGERDKTDCD